MKQDDFLVTTTVNGKSWTVLWDNDEPLGLDHPVFWEMHSTEQGIRLYHQPDGKIFAVEPEYVEESREINLPLGPGESRQVTLQLKKLKRIRPAFMPDLEAIKKVGPADHYVSAGIREYLISFNAIEGGYQGAVEDLPVFELMATPTGFQVTAKRSVVRFKIMGEPSRPLPVGSTVLLSAKEVHGGAFIWGSYWWRVAKLPTPEMLDLDELDREEADQDAVPMMALAKGLGTLFLFAVIVLRAVYYMDLYHAEKFRKPPIITEVELKKPKIIPRIEPPKPPEPPKVVLQPPPPPPPKEEPPPPKKKERPKIAKRQPPRRKPPEPRKIARREPPKPVRPVPVRRPEPVPPPRVVAKTPPREAPPRHVVIRNPPPVVARPETPNPALQKAEEKAALAKSLNFLSTGPSKNVNALATIPGAKFSAKYKDAGSGALPASGSVLNQMANKSAGDGAIATRGARSVASNSGIHGRHGKGLNDIQGRVSLNTLYAGRSNDDLGAAADGMSVIGPGQISDAAIEKTLARYLQKFQYCYEKALLYDSTLAGTIQMEWTINPGGSVSGAKVVRSAMNNAGLHSCLARVLSKITFPSPSGGPVTVKKPFSFQSSTI